MEVVGAVASIITISKLFKTCIEAFDVFKAAQNQRIDLRKAVLKLNIEKCRLYIWGEAVGLTSDARPKKRPIDSFPYPELVQETLEFIIKALGDSEQLEIKYGCKILLDVDGEQSKIKAPRTSVLQSLNASFDNFKLRSSDQICNNSVAKKTLWAVHHRQKFESLVLEAKSLIDGLQDITKDLQSSAAQSQMMTSRIAGMTDVRALDWVSEVSQADYPELSEVAATVAETISDIGTVQRNIRDWKDKVTHEQWDDQDDTPNVEAAIAKLEDMTLTELKHEFTKFLLCQRAVGTRMSRPIETPPYQPKSFISSAGPKCPSNYSTRVVTGSRGSERSGEEARSLDARFRELIIRPNNELVRPRSRLESWRRDRYRGSPERAERARSPSRLEPWRRDRYWGSPERAELARSPSRLESYILDRYGEYPEIAELARQRSRLESYRLDRYREYPKTAEFE